MSDKKTMKSALISVFHKEGLDPIVQKLKDLDIKIFSTGGTSRYIQNLGAQVTEIEDLTGFPAVLGGRVKTLHPKIFGGILNRRGNPEDQKEIEQHGFPEIDLVICDLYPFGNTVAETKDESEIIEKIDIGGISLIRAGAKNFRDVLCISQRSDYQNLMEILKKNEGASSLSERRHFAAKSFQVSSHYDTAIFNYFNRVEEIPVFRQSFDKSKKLRYGENPHQKGLFHGDFSALFDQIHGKELSYNNLLDVDAAVNLMAEFKNETPTFAILKHNNACGLAQRETLHQAYIDALAGDPKSAFGGILIANKTLDHETASEINNLFCEVVIAPAYEEKALKTLQKKKKRIILIQKEQKLPENSVRTCLNGLLEQEKDLKTDAPSDLNNATKKEASAEEIEDLLFASKICKHTKSNCIVLTKNRQLIASGTGQTSRVDSLEQGIDKARRFGFDLNGAVMASDAFFPFPDCVEIANEQGIKAVIQPGGSIKDQDSIDFCDKNNMTMVMTGNRHFKH